MREKERDRKRRKREKRKREREEKKRREEVVKGDKERRELDLIFFFFSPSFPPFLCSRTYAFGGPLSDPDAPPRPSPRAYPNVYSTGQVVWLLGGSVSPTGCCFLFLYWFGLVWFGLVWFGLFCLLVCLVCL